MNNALIVTGSSSGIGAATAKLAGARGWPICVNYRSSKAEAETVAHDIVSGGGKAIVVGGDMANEADITTMFETCDAELGQLGGLVNNAGITGPVNRVEQITSDVLHEVMNLNVVGCFLCAREAIKRMSRDHDGSGGGIVNVSSRASGIGAPGEWVHYAASKGAIDSFTIGLSKEVAAEGIRVNAVTPGLIETDIHAKAGVGDRLEKLAPGVPMQRTGTAEEVAEVIVWLLSEQSSYVSGAIVPVGGGR